MATLTRASFGRLNQRRQHPFANADTPIESYFRFAQRQWLLIADGILCGILAVTAYLLTMPASYGASATVMLGAVPNVSGGRPSVGSDITVDSDAQVAASAQVLKKAAARVHFPGGDSALADRVNLTARPNSRVLTIEVRADTVSLAREAAEAIATELLNVRRRDITSHINAQRVALRRQIQKTTAQLAAISTATSATTPPEGGTTLPVGETRALLDKLSALQVEEAELVGQAADPGFVTAPARAEPSGWTGLQAKLASGAMFGMLAGLAAAWLRDRGRPLSRRPSAVKATAELEPR